MKTISLIIALLCSAALRSQTDLPPDDPLYHVVFEDDFSGAVTDTSKWKTSYGWGQFIPGETQLPIVDSDGDTLCSKLQPHRFLSGLDYNPFSTHNRKFNSGVMELYGLKEPNGFATADIKFSPCPSAACTSHGAGCFTSNGADHCMWVDTLYYKLSHGMLFSKQLFKYGYYELKFRLPVTSAYNSIYKSISPNFWLFGGDANTIYSEIDFHEVNLSQNGRVGNTIHVQQTSSSTRYSPNIPHNYGVTEGQWQTNAGWWTKDSVSFWLNNTMTSNLKNGYCIPCQDIDKLSAMNLIIDMHLPAFNFCIPFDTAQAPLPYKYEIDYVKVYQPIAACDSNKTYLNTTAGTFTHKIYKSLTFGGSGGSVVFNNAKVHPAATDYILLLEGTEIGNNAIVTINTMGCSEDYQYRQKIPNGFSPLPYSNEQFLKKRLRDTP